MMMTKAIFLSALSNDNKKMILIVFKKAIMSQL